MLWSMISIKPYIIYAGELFTGATYEYFEDDSIRTEIYFVNGLMDGTSKSWYASGNLKDEYHLKKGGGHGTSRDWDEDGTLRREQVIEFGIVLQRKEWNGRGELIEHFIREETDPQYKILLLRREKWKNN